MAPEVVRTRVIETGQLEPGLTVLRLGFSKLPRGKSYFVWNKSTDLYVYGQGADARTWIRVRIQKQDDGSRVVLSPTSSLVWLIMGIFSLAWFGIEGLSLIIAVFFSMVSADGLIFWNFMLLGSAFFSLMAFVGHRHDCWYVDRIAEIFERFLVK